MIQKLNVQKNVWRKTMITRSVEENIRIAFDRFYDNLKFKGVELTDETLKEFLSDLEENVVKEALSEYTSEREAAYEEGYEEAYVIGYEEGYDVGYEDAKGACQCTQ
jgi:flagellar biosynthesis/type III secretory pathway protein FliH